MFNVCSQLGDGALISAGLDPATKRVLTDPPTGPSTWRSCNWKSIDNRYGVGGQRVDVFSTSHTLAEARAKEGVIGVRDTTVGARPGLTFQEGNDPESCYVAFEASQGMFEVAAGALSDQIPSVDKLCELAKLYAANLEPHLPK